MKKELPGLTKTAVLARRCASFAGRTGAPCDHASLPVPVPGVSGLRAAVMLARTEPVDGSSARRIFAPSHVVYAAAMTGDFVELAAISAGDLGLEGEPGAALGEVVLAADREAKRARLFELIDVVSPVFATGRAAETREVKSAAAALLPLWDEVAEAPLRPWYRALGRRFFGWVERAAAP